DAELRQMPVQRIDGLRALARQQRRYTIQALQRLLSLALNRNRAQIRAARRFSNGPRIAPVVLAGRIAVPTSPAAGAAATPDGPAAPTRRPHDARLRMLRAPPAREGGAP